ncbi:cytochrome P450 [Microbulbifer litoralis]|uniref:cytochrome P450 n=1 Tax=Microbulbifer litoralis TaxID=2933965 RepID=UPI0020296915|nr:cytochrome P450 [Microbulbifer sp. GX H0434]
MYRKLNEEMPYDGSMDSATENEKERVIPGPSLFSWDNISPFISDKMHLKLRSLSKKYGDVFQVNMAGEKWVILTSYQSTWDALVNQEGLLVDRAAMPAFRLPPVGYFMETKSGDHWIKHRGLFLDSIKEYFSGRWSEIGEWLYEETERLSDYMESEEGNAFDPNNYITLTNLSFIQRMMFGERYFEGDDNDFDGSVLTYLPNGFIHTVRYGYVPKILHMFYLSRKKTIVDFRDGINKLADYVSRNFEERSRSYDPNNMRDVCDHLIRACSLLSEDERETFDLQGWKIAIGSLSQFAGAGTGVATFAIRWALIYLVKNSDVQEELYNEMRSVLTEPPKMSDKSKLPYMQAFINEVLRHSGLSPMPAIYYATSRDGSIKGYPIKKGTPVIVDYYGVTRDSNVWKSPDSFDPKRFIDVHGKLDKEKQNKFFPFGVGARRCVGEHIARMQVFLFCANLVYRFRYSAPSENAFNVEEMPGVFLVPKSFKIKAEKRIHAV